MSDKRKQVLSWIIAVVAIVFLCEKENTKDVKYICAQSIILWSIELIGCILGKIPFVGAYITLVTTIFCIAICILGLIKIYQDSKGEELNLPLVGNLAKVIFRKVIEG